MLYVLVFVKELSNVNQFDNIVGVSMFLIIVRKEQDLQNNIHLIKNNSQ
jgi:hypothetical protein